MMWKNKQTGKVISDEQYETQVLLTLLKQIAEDDVLKSILDSVDEIRSALNDAADFVHFKNKLMCYYSCLIRDEYVEFYPKEY